VGEGYDQRSLRLRAIGWSVAAATGLTFWIVVGVCTWMALT
jgi:hypothetical protein